MNDDADRTELPDAADDGEERAPEVPAGDDVHLEPSLQSRNALIYAALTSLIYLAAPVIYVGNTQAALCDKLEALKTVSNLPKTMWLLMTPSAILIAWLVPQLRRLKITIAMGFLAQGLAGAAMAAILLLPTAAWLRIASVLAHAVVIGFCNGVVWSFNWEALARGVSESRRAMALAWSFGVGPVFAVLGSLGSQLILSGKIFGWEPPFWQEVAFPYNFAIVFGLSAPIMFLAAYLSRLYFIPMPATDVQRRPFREAVFGGFGSFVRHRAILLCAVGYVLLYAASMVQINFVLVTGDKVGLEPQDVVGYQNAIRFACKILAGFWLAWMLKRTHPRMCISLTALLEIASVLWVILAPGMWFLLAFGIAGAGELLGVYYPNYIVSCSPKSQVRRNMAFVKLIGLLAAPAPATLGWIADTWGISASLWVALVFMAAALVVGEATLPKRPQPRPEDLEGLDVAAV